VDRQWTERATEWTKWPEWIVSDQSTGGQSGQTVDREGNGVDIERRVDSLRPVDRRTEWTDSGQGGQRSGHRGQSGQSQTSRREDRADREWTERATEWTKWPEWIVSDQSTGGQSGQTVDREDNGVDIEGRVDSLRPDDGRTERTESGQRGQRSGHRGQSGQSQTSRREDRADREWTERATEWTSRAEWTVSDQSTGGQSGQRVDREDNGVDIEGRVDSLRPATS